MTAPNARVSPEESPSSPSRKACAWSALFVALISIFSAWLASQIEGFPIPVYHDEHSYLLSGETFASGHLANPAHPMGFFFETYHQLQTPTYASKYPPAQGLFLALGDLLGSPLYGVWLSHALLGAAAVWMCRAFMPLRWSVLAGVYVAIWFGFICYWVQSYWGGTVAALGGVLVWGAAKRLHVRIQAAPSLALGLGAALLMLSRPFEGLLACLVPGVLILNRLRRSYLERRLAGDAWKLGLLLIPVLLAAAFQARLNHAVTGDYLRFPYSEYNRQYDANPILFWQSPGTTPSFHHERMENFDYKVAEELTRFPTPALPLFLGRASNFVVFYSGGILLFALLVYTVRPSRWAKWMFWSVGVNLSSIVLVYYYYPHYLAPALAPAVILVFWTLRTVFIAVRRSDRHRRTYFMTVLAVIVLALLVRKGGMVPLEAVAEHAIHRQAVQKKLEEDSGRHLVLVDYDVGVNPHVEYVFNGANIDAQKVIWARWHKDAGKRGLFDYYKDRKLWMLRVVRNGEPQLREFSWVPGS